jgi:very-short-patch-repair endonuclease
MTDDPRIREILRRQFRIHMSELARAAEDRYWALSEECGSPIEKLLLAALMFIRPMCLHPRYHGPADAAPEARLHVQHKIAGYRVDFGYVVTPFREPPIKLAIECDGHDFHASKEQRGNDANRDAILTGEGYHPLRFTGTQIHADPEACAQMVADTVDRLYATRIHRDVETRYNGEDAA